MRPGPLEPRKQVSNGAAISSDHRVRSSKSIWRRNYHSNGLGLPRVLEDVMLKRYRTEKVGGRFRMHVRHDVEQSGLCSGQVRYRIAPKKNDDRTDGVVHCASGCTKSVVSREARLRTYPYK